MPSFGRGDAARMRLRTGDKPALEITILDDGGNATFKATPTITRTGDAMKMEATLPELGPVSISGNLQSDDTYDFTLISGTKKVSGEARLLGNAPTGLTAQPLKSGYYVFDVEAGGGDLFRRPAGPLSFAVQSRTSTKRSPSMRPRCWARDSSMPSESVSASSTASA